jgi:hypothetical protein
MRLTGRMTAGLASLAAFALLGGCASGPAVRSMTDPAADFGTYRTYGFLEHLGTDRGDYSTIVSRALKAAVAVEMEKRGYRAADNPDLLVNFQASTRKTQELSPAPAMMSGRFGYYSGLDGPFYPYGCMQSARDVNEGTLNIDLVDRTRHQSVWEGVALGEVRESKLRQPELALPPLVTQIFTKFPYVAGRGAPVVPQP